MRGSPSVHDARVRVYAVDDDLSRSTRAIQAAHKRELTARSVGSSATPKAVLGTAYSVTIKK